jgi:lincosamide nucleotidyltransferase A/C/D/E
MYHWRVLPGPGRPLPEELADVERVVAYWGGGSGVRRRIEALQQSCLALSSRFELSRDEAGFHDRHRSHDHCYTAPHGNPGGAAAIIARHAPLAAVMWDSPTRMINASLRGVMTADDVLSILAVLRNADADIWIGGGWGIDALVGQQTRRHRDLDLMHRKSQEPAVVAALANAGFAETLDWRPVRFVVTDPHGREIDLHPLIFAADGSAVQASPDPEHPFAYPASCFDTGTILGTTVPCLSPEQQVYFHQGYEPADHDRHDMARLRQAFGIATHF